MRLVLSAADQDRLRDTYEVLLTAPEPARIHDWRASVDHALRRLVDADHTLSVCPLAGTPLTYSPDYPVTAAGQYPDLVEPLNARVAVWRKAAQLGVFSRRELWAPYLEEYYESPYYNEWVIPVMRSYDAIGVARPLEQAIGAEAASQVIMCRSSARGRRFSERELGLLRLVHPAYAAGIANARLVARAVDSTSTYLEELGVAAFLFDGTSRLVHVTQAAMNLLRNEPRREEIRAAAAVLATELGPGSNRLPDGPPSVGLDDDDYRLRVMYVPAVGDHHVLVSVERRQSGLPSPAQIRQRYDLTEREAAVALLIARGRSNARIAKDLGISPHTARRHTERVFYKVGIGSRSEIAPLLAGVTPDRRADG